MPKTMLIDATHAEETRVAVVDGNRLVEYDYESKVRKQLKGSVFLAKVTRVEPSLQAAFVNFGGNRHGFLPFSEIHPDYFRIPVADREALIAAQRAELEEHDSELEKEEAVEDENVEADLDEDLEEDEEEDDLEPVVEVGGEDKPHIEEDDEEGFSEETAEQAEEEPEYRAPVAMKATTDVLEGPLVEQDDADAEAEEGFAEADGSEEETDSDISEQDDQEEGADAQAPSEEGGEASAQDGNRNRGRRGNNRGRGRFNGRGRGRHGRRDRDDQSVDSLGGDTAEGDRPFRFNLRRNYKIQEVIKRGQIMLIQVSKEERGNKGAAVTTYLSMPGRYCVLMPNSPRGGGVSRKIASFKDRKRMKEMLDDLSVPDGMSVILRTAGVARTKVEIKRDLDYLTRLWNTIREHTLKSTAPALIYEEGNLIKRAIRDLYSRDIEDVHVSGDEGYKAAKEFMKMLMPSHAKKVQEYKNNRVPMFHKFGVEAQIADIGQPSVNLKSGGYLVINPTEALVSVDVNSGRATKERHIEETALKTNLEAADEVARQLRLRDLGGLVVIDFIDMEDRRNNRKVEQRLRDALSNDRARIQVGRISSFGLLELSRQRLNPSLAEAQEQVCAHCAGTGRVKTLDFSAISIIRALEAEGIKGKGHDVCVTLASSVAMYVLNNKRKLLTDIENRYGFDVSFVTDDSLSTSQFTLEATARSAPKVSEGVAPIMMVETSDDVEDLDLDDEIEQGEEQPARNRDNAESNGENDEGRSRRRRGRRGGRGRGRGRDQNASSDTDEGGNTVSKADGNIDDDIGNRVEEDSAPDDNIGNRAPGENGNRGGRRRGGRGRGKGGRPEGREDRGDAPVLKEGHAPSVEPAVHVAKPIDAKPAPEPSNDVPPAPRDYETVNQAPEKKKKGWWNKLVE